LSRNTRPFILAMMFSVAMSAGILAAWPSVQQTPPEQGHPLVPKRALLMHRSECQSSAECPARHACLPDSAVGRRRCLPSECEVDTHCPSQEVCRIISTDSAGSFVRRCQGLGQRQEGEACTVLSGSARNMCAAGLICQDSFCGRRCAPDDPGTCPEGFSCEHGPEGDVCHPSCVRARCANGQRCFTIEEGSPVCGVPVEGGCMNSPCPAGQRCRFSFRPEGDVVFVARTCVVDPP